MCVCLCACSTLITVIQTWSTPYCTQRTNTMLQCYNARSCHTPTKLHTTPPHQRERKHGSGHFALSYNRILSMQYCTVLYSTLHSCAIRMHLGSASILVPQPSWFRMHLGSASILVPHASWFRMHLGSASILVPRASWFRMHLGSACILVPHASWFRMHLGSACILVPHASWDNNTANILIRQTS